MKIAVIGASGKAGSFIVKEALSRDHEVTAIVRSSAKIKDVPVIEKDIFDITAEDLKPFDIVVNAFGAAPGNEHLHVEAGRVLIQALQGSPETRLIVVGGAGSLFVDDEHTIRVIDTPDFPKEYIPTASNQGKNLEDLKQSTGIQWTFISPSAFFDPIGPRNGSYHKGSDKLLVNSEGNSYISYADYAIAVVDEIEKPAHVNQRFTVVGEAK